MAPSDRRENFGIHAGLYALTAPRQVVESALDTFDLQPYTSVRATELSKGLSQKVALARALLHAPAILLLDEPPSGLDHEVTRSVRGMLDNMRWTGGAVVLSTHDLDEFERHTNRVAVSHRRLLVLDRPAILRRQLTTGLALARIGNNPSAYLDTACQFNRVASIKSARDPQYLRTPVGHVKMPFAPGTRRPPTVPLTHAPLVPDSINRRPRSGCHGCADRGAHGECGDPHSPTRPDRRRRAGWPEPCPGR